MNRQSLLEFSFMTTDSLSRKERERLRHKEEIVAGALKLFAEKGFHNVSMQEIAAATEFATGTLYNFFPSKEALYSELMLNCGRKILALLLPILEGTESEDQKLRRFIEAHRTIFTEHMDMIRLYMADVNRMSMVITPPLEEEIEQIRVTILDRLTAVIQSGAENGMFRVCNARIVALALDAMLESLAFSAVTYPQSISMEQGLPQIEAMLFDGLRRREGTSHAE
jgi:TetR/AcrR family transcriptional regulator